MNRFTLALALISTLAVCANDATAATAPRRTIELDAGLSLSPTSMGPAAILSPDGTILVFVAQTTAQKRLQLYVRRLSQSRATPLAGSEGADSPFFSPDGKWIGFFADGRIKKIAVGGGDAITICSACSAIDNARGGSWAEDGTIFFSPNPRSPLMRVSSAGGSREPLTTLDAATNEMTQRWPQALPGGKAVMFTANNQTGDFEDANIVVQSLPNGPRKIVHRGGYYGRYLATGHLVYMRAGTLFVAPFDIDRLELTGDPAPAIKGIGGSSAFGGADVSFSSRGALAFVPGAGIPLVVPIQWMDFKGPSQPLRAVPAFYNHPRFSPDGSKLALDIREHGQYDVWVYEWERDKMSRLTAGAGDNKIPVWTPDGARIAFSSTRRNNSTLNLYWQRADGAEKAEALLQSENEQTPGSWHPTGNFLAYGEQHPKTGWDIMMLPFTGDDASGRTPGKPTVFLATSFEEMNPAFSPDGRWVAYHSNDSGKLEVYVRPFAASGDKQQISLGGGMYPFWSRDEKKLFYQNTEDWTLRVATFSVEGESFRAEPPKVVGPIPRRGHGMPGVDIHPDGRRFAVLKAAEESAEIRENKVTLIPHFIDERRQIAPGKR
jgi:serine/threonine-protein kinase